MGNNRGRWDAASTSAGSAFGRPAAGGSENSSSYNGGGGRNPKIIFFFSPASLIFALQMRPLNVFKMKQAAEFRSFLNSYLLNKNNKRTI